MKSETRRSSILIVALALLLAAVFYIQSKQPEAIKASQWEYAFRFVGHNNALERMTEVTNEMASNGWHFVDFEAFTEGSGSNGVDARHLVFRRVKND